MWRYTLLPELRGVMGNSIVDAVFRRLFRPTCLGRRAVPAALSSTWYYSASPAATG
jgi:hypothetical protein